MDSQSEQKKIHWDLLLIRATLCPHSAWLAEMGQVIPGCQIYPMQIVRDYIYEYFVNLRNPV